jgi:hypothetical protein
LHGSQHTGSQHLGLQHLTRFGLQHGAGSQHAGSQHEGLQQRLNKSRSRCPHLGAQGSQHESQLAAAPQPQSTGPAFPAYASQASPCVRALLNSLASAELAANVTTAATAKAGSKNLRTMGRTPSWLCTNHAIDHNVGRVCLMFDIVDPQSPI